MTDTEGVPPEPGYCHPHYADVAEVIRDQLKSSYLTGQPIYIARADPAPVNELEVFGAKPTIKCLKVSAAVDPGAGTEWLIAVDDAGRSVAGHAQ